MNAVVTPEEFFERLPYRGQGHPIARIGESMWMHHLELRDPSQIDGEVRGWLEAAYEGAK